MMKFFPYFKDLGVEGAQAQYYDKLCREHRLEEIKAQVRQVAKCIKNGDTLLEVAPGPGYLSIELSKLGQYKIVGLDISSALVEIAKRNAQEAGGEFDFMQGNASAMPFQANMFNAIVCVQQRCLRVKFRIMRTSISFPPSVLAHSPICSKTSACPIWPTRSAKWRVARS